MKLEYRAFPIGLAATLAGLALGGWCASAAAATGMDEDCPETGAELVAEISPPSLKVDAAEHVGDAAVSDTDDATARPLAGSRETARTGGLLGKALPPPAEDADSVASGGDSNRELPPTEMQLPGVAEEDLPRFRRQMFRTDI